MQFFAADVPTVPVAVAAALDANIRRDQIILDHLPLVKGIAIRVHINLPTHVDLDDLIHAGVMGLFEAVEKYDHRNGVAFHHYAKHRIKGAILDSLRQADWASRSLRSSQKHVESVRRDLANKLGHDPQDTEVAAELGIDMVRLGRMQTKFRTSVVSATANSGQHCDRVAEVAATGDTRPDRICERRQRQTALAIAISELPIRYQKVVTLYYTNDMTMKEIGIVLGVNESRVSQIRKHALKKMAKSLGSVGIQSAAAL
jgi:RNA polymerase sigma factor FliA